MNLLNQNNALEKIEQRESDEIEYIRSLIKNMK